MASTLFQAAVSLSLSAPKDADEQDDRAREVSDKFDFARALSAPAAEAHLLSMLFTAMWLREPAFSLVVDRRDDDLLVTLMRDGASVATAKINIISENSAQYFPAEGIHAHSFIIDHLPPAPVAIGEGYAAIPGRPEPLQLLREEVGGKAMQLATGERCYEIASSIFPIDRAAPLDDWLRLVASALLASPGQFSLVKTLGDFFRLEIVIQPNVESDFESSDGGHVLIYEFTVEPEFPVEPA